MSPSLTRVSPRALDNAPTHEVTDSSMMKVVGGDRPAAKRVISFTGSDGKFVVGVAAYEKTELALEDWPVDEFMYFLEGAVEITDSAGVTQRMAAGDAIVMPKGFSGLWRQLSPIKKISVFYMEHPLPISLE